MNQYNVALPDEYNRRGRMFDIGRNLYIVCLVLSVICSLFLTMLPITCGYYGYDFPLTNPYFQFVIKIPNLIGIAAAVCFALGDRRFSLFGIILGATLSLTLIVGQYGEYQNVYLNLEALLYGGLILSALCLYWVFDQSALNRRIVLIVLLQLFSLGRSIVAYYSYKMPYYTQIIERLQVVLAILCLLGIIIDILLIILFYKIGNAKNVYESIGGDDNWSMKDFFTNRLFIGYIVVIAFIFGSSLLLFNNFII